MEEFVILDDVLYSYTGDKQHVYIPFGVKTIKADFLPNNHHVEHIYLPHSVEVIESGALRNCTINSEYLPCVERYLRMEGRSIFSWNWYNCNVHEHCQALSRQLKEKRDLYESLLPENAPGAKERAAKENRIFTICAIASIPLAWLLKQTPWVKGLLANSWPSLFAFLLHAVAFVALWVASYFVSGVVLSMILVPSPEDTSKEQRQQLEKEIQDLESQLEEERAYRGKRTDEVRDRECPRRVELPTENNNDMTWANGLPWTVNYDNAKDM